MDAKNAQLQSIHAKQESDLKKQIIDLKAKLESANCGRQAESEMYEEAMVKTQRLETMVNELNAKVTYQDYSKLSENLIYLAINCHRNITLDKLFDFRIRYTKKIYRN